MDTETGAILAMATSSPFDPNKPMQLSATFQEKLEISVLLMKGFLQAAETLFLQI